MTRNYRWWKSRKRRVQKKYTLFLGKYYSKKEIKAWRKAWRKACNRYKRKKRGDIDNEID